MFLQLRKSLPAAVMLVEATTDPGRDSPQALRAYAQMVGADWTFATGSPEQMEAFWSPFDVQLSGLQLHNSTLVIIDAHRLCAKFQPGYPDLNGQLPAVLRSQLSALGLQQLYSHGDGWAAPQILDTLRAIRSVDDRGKVVVATAPPFAAKGLSGQPVRTDQFAGRPLVINFWASYCAPCRAELKLLQQAAGEYPNVGFLLVDEGNNPSASRRLLSELGVKLPVALDPNRGIGSDYQIVGLPTTVFIWPDQTVQGWYGGQLDVQTLHTHLAHLSSTAP